VTAGDFATTTVEGRFSVAYVVANTIMNLTTARRAGGLLPERRSPLGPDGCFVIEVLVPRLQRPSAPGETFQPFALGPTHVGFDEYDVVS
jgi:hypothetical protein